MGERTRCEIESIWSSITGRWDL